jgi:hypothetical protein
LREALCLDIRSQPDSLRVSGARLRECGILGAMRGVSGAQRQDEGVAHPIGAAPVIPMARSPSGDKTRITTLTKSHLDRCRFGGSDSQNGSVLPCLSSRLGRDDARGLYSRGVFKCLSIHEAKRHVDPMHPLPIPLLEGRRVRKKPRCAAPHAAVGQKRTFGHGDRNTAGRKSA